MLVLWQEPRAATTFFIIDQINESMHEPHNLGKVLCLVKSTLASPVNPLYAFSVPEHLPIAM